MASSMNQFMIPIFFGKNYDHWAFIMRTILCSQELLEILLNGFAEPLHESLLTVDQKDELKKKKEKIYKGFSNYSTRFG